MQRFLGSVYIDPNGYRWVDIDDDREERNGPYPTSPVLRGASYDRWMRKLEAGQPVTFEPTYDPFIEEPALFRIFAAVEPTPEAILAFANKYGDIGSFDRMGDHGQPLWIWQREIGHARKGIEHAEKISAALVSGKSKRKALKDAMMFLGATVEAVPVYLTPVTHSGGAELRTFVGNLLDVIKLQLALSLVENKRYRNCEQCDKPFELTPQINRSDRLFCSDNCRVKSYQRRKKQAIALRQQGEPLRAIAKATSSDMRTVKRWMEGVNRKEA